MSFIGQGGCRHCGCREYVKPQEGEKCYHCNHKMDLHVVKYQPQPTVGASTRKTHDRGAVIAKRVSPMTGKDGDIGSSEDMVIFTDVNRDKYGVVRGKCRDCPKNCPQYSLPVLRHNCTYCGCPAGQHERVEPRPELIIKIEPGEEGAGSPERPVGRSQPGLSRKQDGLLTAQAQPRSSRRNKSPIVPRKHPDTSGAVTQKRCKTLFEDTGVKYSHLKRKLRKKKRGVFTILWKGVIIYVGEPKKTSILSSLRSIFAGRSNQDISTFFKSLPKDLKKKHIRIAWLKHMDDDPHRQTCGKGKKKVVSYRQCISKLLGRDPKDVLRYYMTGNNIRR